MSKAFTKESDSDDGLDGDEESGSALPTGIKNYITPEGAQKLKQELHQLLHEARPEMVKTVSWAASNGDRSENGDYIYGKRRLREIDRRIRFLTKRLESAEIVDSNQRDRPVGAKKVLFGAFVELRGEEGASREYRIVGIDETDVPRGWISWISPLAKAVLNAEVGDVIQFRSPKGEEELEVLRVWF